MEINVMNIVNILCIIAVIKIGWLIIKLLGSVIITIIKDLASVIPNYKKHGPLYAASSLSGPAVLTIIIFVISLTVFSVFWGIFTIYHCYTLECSPGYLVQQIISGEWQIIGGVYQLTICTGE